MHSRFFCPTFIMGICFVKFEIVIVKDKFIISFCSVADTDPGSGAFLTPGSGKRDG
jgi:hypothetical protein